MAKNKKQYYAEVEPTTGTAMPADVLMDPVKFKQWMKDHPEATVVNANKQVIKNPSAVKVDPRLLKNTPTTAPNQGTIDYPASDPRSQSYTGAPATTLLMNPNQVQGEGARIIEAGNNLPILVAATAPAIVPIAAPAEGAANILFGYQGLKAGRQAVNDFRNYDYDEGLIHSGEAALGILPAVGGVSNAVKEASPFVRNTIANANKVLGTEEGLLSNAYKYNPKAFVIDNDKLYRQIGEAGLQDAKQTGVIRSKDRTRFRLPYFVQGKDFEVLGSTGAGATGKRPNVIFEMPMLKSEEELNAFPVDPDAPYTPWVADLEEIPLSTGTIYKKHWLQGYKPINVENKIASGTGEKSIGFIQPEDYYNNLPPLTDKEALSVLDDLKKRITTPEGKKRLKELGIGNKNFSYNLNNNLKVNADVNAGGYSRGLQIGINPNLPLKSQTMRHELEHFIQNQYNLVQQDKAKKWYDRFYTSAAGNKRRFDALSDNLTNIDKSLNNLELNKTPENVDWNSPVKQSVFTARDFSNSLLNDQHATNYFHSGSMGREKSPMLAEVQQFMMDEGIIPKDKYVDVTPEMVEDTYRNIVSNNSGNGKYLRLFNIMKPTKANYELVANNLNKMLSIAPYAVPAATVPTILQNYQGLKKQKNGGWLNKYK